jgi:hypothetical protein
MGLPQTKVYLTIRDVSQVALIVYKFFLKLLEIGQNTNGFRGVTGDIKA